MSGYKHKKKFLQKCGFKKWDMVKYVERKSGRYLGCRPYSCLKEEYQTLSNKHLARIVMNSYFTFNSGWDENVQVKDDPWWTNETDPMIVRFIKHNQVLYRKVKNDVLSSSLLNGIKVSK